MSLLKLIAVIESLELFALYKRTKMKILFFYQCYPFIQEYVNIRLQETRACTGSISLLLLQFIDNDCDRHTLSVFC